jgi:5'-3' exonuclease
MKRLIVDVSSVTWRGLLAGIDKEFGYKVMHEGKEVKINSAAFGYENVMNAILSPMKKLGIVPMDVILVIEGESSKSFRRAKLKTYKDGDTKPPESYEEFAKTIQLVKAAFLAVGAKVCSQPYIESDDVIAHLCHTLDGEKTVLSEDGDLMILTDLPGVSQWRQGELTNTNPYGPWPTRFITLYKSLVGDTSDNIKGAWKFGKGGFLDLYCLFGDEGLDALEAMVTCPNAKRATMGLGLLAEDVAEFKPLQRIMDSADEVYVCYEVAKLYPDQIDTRRKPLSWEVGMVKPLTAATDERLRPWAGRVRLVHAANYAEALQWAKTKVEETPWVALDIETSTPLESDDWCEANRKKSGDKVIDVFGSELTGMSITFGNNAQYTF